MNPCSLTHERQAASGPRSQPRHPAQEPRVLRGSIRAATAFDDSAKSSSGSPALRDIQNSPVLFLVPARVHVRARAPTRCTCSGRALVRVWLNRRLITIQHVAQQPSRCARPGAGVRVAACGAARAVTAGDQRVGAADRPPRTGAASPTARSVTPCPTAAGSAVSRARWWGMKPPQFAVWMFCQLGVRPGDELVDLCPGAGAIGEAWRRYAAAARDTSPVDGGQVAGRGWHYGQRPLHGLF